MVGLDQQSGFLPLRSKTTVRVVVQTIKEKTMSVYAASKELLGANFVEAGRTWTPAVLLHIRRFER